MKEIELFRGQMALVDDDDFENLNLFRWYLSSYGYAVRNVNRKVVFMHRQILNATAGTTADHKDGNKLNNQKENLRICSIQQNTMNKAKQKTCQSGYKGVSVYVLSSGSVRYRARLVHNGKWVLMKSFLTAVDAAKAYDEAARFHFGNYARTNFENT